MSCLLFLEGATVVRQGNPVLRDLTWSVHEGETWAIVGPTGCGKTTLAELLLGRHRLESGTLAWPLLDRLRAAGRSVAWASDVVHLVSFKEESWLLSYQRHYYQQRFNWIEPQDDLTLDAFLRAATSASDDEVHAAAARLGVEGLLSMSLLKLSNGQMRRARIVRALLARPELLILDEPFLGLDAAGRRDLADLLGSLIRQGLRVLLITRPETIPSWVTHVLDLEPFHCGLRIADCGVTDTKHSEPAVSPCANPQSAIRNPQSGVPIVELNHVTVAYNGQAILNDVSWTVRLGERWAVLGPNGAGKTTLLSLICADHPQAYANDIRLFGRQRGSGESIWEIKRQIGLVSPELHLYFTEPLNAAEVAATGFFDVLAYRPTTAEQDARVRGLFAEFGIAGLEGRPFAQLSTGEQRLVLLVRALVKSPPLLVLDEPFQALDTTAIRRARAWLDDRLQPEQTLIFVSHYPEEIPASVTRRLVLEAGCVVAAREAK
jgi:molybdate transport system ATP-binding protein